MTHAADTTDALGTLLTQGKAKTLYTTGDPDVLTVRFKDEATAFNGKKHAHLPGKGALNAAISRALFTVLKANGVPTCFVDEPAPQPDCLIYRKLTMLPVEVVVRNVAYGSVCKRYALAEGHRFEAPVVEYFLKSDAVDDPLLSEAMILTLGVVPDTATLALTRRRALQINEILWAYFEARGICCADFKLEFGRDANGQLCLGDEMSPDNFRLRDHGTHAVLDKDVFRKDLGDLVTTYTGLLARMEAGPPLVMTTLKSYRATVVVDSRANILNPESRAIGTALKTGGFSAVQTVRAGKHFELTLEAPSMQVAEQQALKIAEDVLSNPVIEDFKLTLEALEPAVPQAQKAQGTAS